VTERVEAAQAAVAAADGLLADIKVALAWTKLNRGDAQAVKVLVVDIGTLFDRAYE
jgi:hypothetical protein